MNYTSIILLTQKICKKRLSRKTIHYIQYICQHIIHTIFNTSKRYTSLSHLYISIHRLFQGQLRDNIIKECEFYSEQQNISHMVFQLKYIRYYIRKNKYHASDIFITGISCLLEYIVAEIIELAYIQSIKLNHSYITPRCLFLSIYYDKELSLMFNRFKLDIIGSGFHPSKSISESNTNTVLHKSINDMTDTICKQYHKNIELSRKSKSCIHRYIESFISKLLIQSDKLCSNFEQNEIRIQDIQYVYQNLKTFS